MFEILPVNDKSIFAFKASGKLTDADYQQFLPGLEGLIRESGCLSLYVELEDFRGREQKAAQSVETAPVEVDCDHGSQRIRFRRVH